ncbi:MAG: hypothetical protein KIS92_08120, partial [Planctomycetota bacterium]|nr:hypothetical protein [Planctomycetota bacterium]
ARVPSGSMRERFQRYNDPSARPRLGLIGFDELPSRPSRPVRRAAPTPEPVPAELRQTPPAPAERPAESGEAAAAQARATA